MGCGICRTRKLTAAVLSCVLLALASSPLEAVDITADTTIDSDHESFSIYDGPLGPTHVRMTASGETGSVGVHQNSSFEMLGGLIRSDLVAYENSQVLIDEGRIGDDLWSYENATVTILGGFYEHGGIYALPSGVIHIYGGVIGNPLTALDGGTIHVYGTNLEGLEEGRLRGLLADSSPIDVEVEGNLVLHQVPEPATLVLAVLAAPAAFLTLRRRRAR